MRREARHPRYSSAIVFALTLLVFVLAAQDVAGAAQPPPGPAADLYASGMVAEIDIDLSQKSFEELEVEPEEYVPGDVTLRFTDGTPGGVTKTLPTLEKVGVRLKGNVEGSFRPIDDKAAFKFKFNEFVKGQTLLGLKKMTLNNMVQDPTMLHETLAYEAFRAAGVPAPRTGYAFVRVNGTAYGVYMDVETFDDVALKRWFGDFDDDVQHLYEGEYGTDVTPGGATAFEVDEGDDENLADLEALIAAVNGPSPAFHTRVEGVADLDEMTRMWGAEKYVGMWDGYAGTNFPKLPNNFFLYSDPSGVFQMFPWGTDQAWEGPLDFGGDAGLMFDECLADSACRSLYLESLRTVGGAVAGLELEPFVSCLTDRLAPWRALEGPPFREFDDGEIETGFEDTEEVLSERPEELTEWLEAESSEPEAITPTGAPASCALPQFEPEVEPKEEPKTKPAGTTTNAVAVVTPENRPKLTRVRRRDGATLDATLYLPAAGRLEAIGKIATYSGSQRVCRVTRGAQEAGKLTVHCHLSSSARNRLRTHRLTVRLVLRFKSVEGETTVITRRIVVPRIHRD
jgi:hypothetical protein